MDLSYKGFISPYHRLLAVDLVGGPELDLRELPVRIKA